MKRFLAEIAAWTYAENGLPTLKNVGGTQSGDLPVWMTSQNKVYIYTAADLAQLATDVNGGNSMSGKTVLLANDIDLSGYPDWTPIGTVHSELASSQLCRFLAYSTDRDTRLPA